MRCPCYVHDSCSSLRSLWIQLLQLRTILPGFTGNNKMQCNAFVYTVLMDNNKKKLVFLLWNVSFEHIGTTITASKDNRWVMRGKTSEIGKRCMKTLEKTQDERQGLLIDVKEKNWLLWKGSNLIKLMLIGDITRCNVRKHCDTVDVYCIDHLTQNVALGTKGYIGLHTHNVNKIQYSNNTYVYCTAFSCTCFFFVFF